MSTLKTTNIQNASSATTNIALDTSGNVTVGGGITASSGTVVMSSPYTMRNKIINGAMVIDQRNAGASITPTNAQFLVDRWQAVLSQASKFSVQQNAGSVTPPSGFTNYLGVTSLSSYSVTATDIFNIVHSIEGFNVADLAWGTASAVPITMSFWVRSSLTGTFGVVLNNSGASRSYPASYTISSANTWEQKTITISGDTSGTWLTNNGAGIQIRFGLGVGSTYNGTAGSWSGSSFYGTTGATSVVGTNGATFYITGVQLERGTAATPFEYRNYQQELAMCQRYYALIRSGASGVIQTTTAVVVGWGNPVEMRTAPTIALYSTALRIRQNGSASFTSTGSTMPDLSSDVSGGWAVVNGFTGLTAGQSAITFPTTAAFTLSAEL